MAKNVTRITSSKKKVKPKRSRSEVYLINRKYYGDEPEFAPGTVFGGKSSAGYARALNWYNTMADRSDAREYLEEYLIGMDLLSEYRKIKEKLTPLTAGWIARLITRGVTVIGGPEFIERAIKEMATLSLKGEIEEILEEGAIPERKPRVRREICIHSITNPVFDIINEWLRGDRDVVIYDYLRGISFPPTRVEILLNEYRPLLEEANRAVSGNPTDKEYVQARWNRKPKEVVGMIGRLIDDLEKYTGAAKKIKKQRVKKAIPVEKKLARFSYMKESPELKVASHNPVKIIGAKEVWAYNTKYDIVNVFRAQDEKGLSVDGVRISGYNTETSKGKKVRKWRDQVIKDVTSLPRVPLRKYMDTLKPADFPANDRFTDQILILRVER